ncbi:hypothetical protein [Streptomyces sp. NPDC056948]|uniref:hypothetical protein n=1 Tax=Streptomyces sp. NPDC056948 TaxID=3345975 RepID=UPI0036389882
MSGSRPLGLLLAWLSAGTVLLDQQMRQQSLHFQRAQPTELGTTGFYTILLMALWWLLRQVRDSELEFPLGRWHISLEKIFRPLAAAAGTYLLLYLIDNPQTHTLLSDPQNPLRLVGIITGVLLSKVGDLSPRPEEPELITQCRSHLYRLQTIQQATHGQTTGAAQILSLGTNHTTSVSTVSPNWWKSSAPCSSA